MLIKLRPVRSFWSGHIRYQVTFWALYDGKPTGVTFQRSHLRALERAIDTARYHLFGGRNLPKETVEPDVSADGQDAVVTSGSDACLSRVKSFS